ncbi:MAG: hypothetical protein ACYC64_04890 [Armatimonadota bacterium]
MAIKKGELCSSLWESCDEPRGGSTVPFLPEQAAIASVSDMNTEVAALKQKRDKTRLIRQGMMQKLLSGRIRLV